MAFGSWWSLIQSRDWEILTVYRPDSIMTSFIRYCLHHSYGRRGNRRLSVKAGDWVEEGRAQAHIEAKNRRDGANQLHGHFPLRMPIQTCDERSVSEHTSRAAAAVWSRCRAAQRWQSPA